MLRLPSRTPSCHPRPLQKPLAFLLTLLTLLGTLNPQPAQAQQRATSFPNNLYYTGVAAYYQGEFRDAGKIFNRARSGAYRGVDGVWIDSICYYAMMGECYYQLGQLPDALAQFDNALSIVVADPGWMQRIDFPAQPNGGRALTQVTWGTPTRSIAKASLPSAFGVLTGRNDGQQVLQQGGVFQRPELRRFDVVEVARCTTLAIRRRNQILGPLLKHDPMAKNLATALRQTASGINNWGAPLANIPLAAALQGTGQFDQAILAYEASLQINGRFDHPLTAMALVEIGKTRLAQNRLNEASVAFLEATYAAAQWDQYDLMEEGFRWGTLVHLMSERPGVYPPLANASNWAAKSRCPQLQASLPILAAECSIAAGDTATGIGLLSQANRFFTPRNDVRLTRWAARRSFAQAHAALQGGDLVAGVKNLADAMAFQNKAGFWLFRLNLVDQFFSNNLISDRVADELYTELLRDPVEADWKYDPMESLSILLTPHPAIYQRWMQIAISRRELDRAVEIADQLRRHNFYTTLPLGGRALALRWLIAAPDGALPDDAARLARQNLLLKYPNLVQLMRESDRLQTALENLPALPERDTEELTQQRSLLKQWNEVALAQEALIGDMALRRIPSDLVFPSLISISDLQAKLPEGQLVWMFIDTPQALLSCMVTKDEYSVTPLEGAASLKPRMTKLLRELGLFDRNAAIPIENLTATEWQDSMLAIKEILAPGRDTEFWSNFDEVVILPDGPLWYLPFELLAVEDDPTDTLIDHVRIRYAPTLGTCTPSDRELNVSLPLAVITGKLHPKDDKELSTLEFAKIKEAREDAVPFDSTLPGPARLVSGLFDTVLVLDDIDDRAKGIYDWAPMRLDAGDANSTLSSMLLLPWRGPNVLALPGFHTAADSGLKGNPNGQEVFATLCALMASGTDTALLSRWRMGGQTSLDLMRQFVTELPEHDPAAAWQLSVHSIREQKLQPDLEPRLRTGREAAPEHPDHPLFWAGYLLADRGRPQKPDEAEVEEKDDDAKDDDAKAPDKIDDAEVDDAEVDGAEVGGAEVGNLKR